MLSGSWLHSSARSLFVSTGCESFSAASVSGVYTIQVVIALQVVVNRAITILVSTQRGSFEPLWKYGIQTIASSCIRHEIIKVLALLAGTFDAIADLYLTILSAIVV
jgi:hypothetical protein